MASVDPDDVEVMTPLTRLLHQRMAEKNWQLRDVVRPPDGNRRGGPARATFSHYLQPGGWLKQLPRQKAMEELAKAVQVDVGVIEEAAVRSLERNRDREPAQTVGGVDEDDDWRYQRPPGISDQEWQRVQAAARPILDALVAQYGDADVRPGEGRG